MSLAGGALGRAGLPLVPTDTPAHLPGSAHLVILVQVFPGWDERVVLASNTPTLPRGNLYLLVKVKTTLTMLD